MASCCNAGVDHVQDQKDVETSSQDMLLLLVSFLMEFVHCALLPLCASHCVPVTMGQTGPGMGRSRPTG
jgi:hypothetical protein